ncbi:MAG: translation elongation factor Ts [Anaerolineae bacterium]|nr:translation elongation factor Ts [Anaerolineae bacterium]
MEITAQMVKELRQATGAGILDCRKALQSADGDFEGAVDYLREKGLAKAAKRMGREAKDGLISAYIHAGSRVGVLIEVNCETDFVARTEEYKEFVNALAMQVAAMNPQYVTREDVPDSVLERERGIYRSQALQEGKPENIVDRIVDGRLEKFYKESCLMEQDYIRDDSMSIDDLVKDHINRTGENIIVRRFVRFELGESLGD